MGYITATVDVEVSIREILDYCDYYDFKQIKEEILKKDLKEYYSEKVNVDPIIAIRLMKAAGVDMHKVYLELHGWFKEIPKSENTEQK